MKSVKEFVNGKSGPWLRLAIMIVAISFIGWQVVQFQQRQINNLKHEQERNAEGLQSLQERMAKMERFEKDLKKIDSRLSRQGDRIEKIYKHLLERDK